MATREATQLAYSTQGCTNHGPYADGVDAHGTPINVCVYCRNARIAAAFALAPEEDGHEVAGVLVTETGPERRAEIVASFERSLGIGVEAITEPECVSCPRCGGWGRFGDDIPCSACDGSGVVDGFTGKPEDRGGVTLDLSASPLLSGSARIAARPAPDREARALLSRFVAWMARGSYTVGEFSKSEGGGSPLTPVYSVEAVVEEYLATQ